VIDDLLEKLGVETGFRLAAQIKAGNLAVRPFLIQPRGVPARIEDALSERYTPGSSRGYALGCALADLEDAGVAIEDVQLMRETSIGTMLDIEAWHAKFRRGIKNPKPPRPRSDPRPGTVVNVDFNAFIMYLIGAGRFDDGDRHIHIWPGSKKGPWLAVEVTGISSAGAQEIDRKLGMTRSEHIAGVRDELGLEPLPSQPSRGGGGARSGG
jgi:hypothetical protein